MEITVTELSAGVYEVVAADATGPRFKASGGDPQLLLETARAWVIEHGRSSLPAHHYLDIYRMRLARAEDGTTRPNESGIEFMQHLVANLEKLDPSTPVRLEIVCGVARFTHAKTGSLLGELNISPHGPEPR